jgi:hypothetical protein
MVRNDVDYLCLFFTAVQAERKYERIGASACWLAGGAMRVATDGTYVPTPIRPTRPDRLLP